MPQPHRAPGLTGNEVAVVLRCDLVVIDVEGTVSPTRAIAGDLYDYARPRLAPHLAAHRSEPEVAAAVAEISQLADVPNPTLEEAVSVLTDWMDSDDKARPLKVLQGRIWAEGFERGELIAQFFEDVIPALRAWRAAGIRLAVFSSGSVASQAAWFGHSPAGDLSGLFSGYFDTSNAGAKREPPAYRAIAESLAVEPSRITFFSDTPAELGAAAAAGLQAIGVARPGEPNELADFDGHRVVASFGDLELPRSAGT